MLVGRVSEPVRRSGGTGTFWNCLAQGHLICFPGFCSQGLSLVGFHFFPSANLGGTLHVGSKLKAAFDTLVSFGN